MGALAIFDAQGNWVQTYVCDGLIQQNLQALGVSWGRSDVFGSQSTGASPLLLDEGRDTLLRAYLAQLQRQFVTDSVALIHLAPGAHGVGPGPQLPGGGRVYWVQAGTLLAYLRSRDGHVGVLCEAGEWLAVVPGMPFALDAGAEPHLDLLVLSATEDGTPDRPRSALAVGASLPSHDAYVEALLEMTGFCGED